MNFPNFTFTFTVCPNGSSFHMAEGCECPPCLVDASNRPTLADHGWTLDSDGFWTKGSRSICDATGQAVQGPAVKDFFAKRSAVEDFFANS